jgi:hypothetical protein
MSSDEAPHVLGTAYSDGTPSVTMSHNELGQPTSVIDGAGMRTLSYDVLGRLELFDGQNLSAPFSGLLFTGAAYRQKKAICAVRYAKPPQGPGLGWSSVYFMGGMGGMGRMGRMGPIGPMRGG